MSDRLPPGDGLGEPDAWAWCPDCESHYPADADCPSCNEGDWDPDDVVGLSGDWDPDDVVGLSGDWWYRDLVTRASFPGIDPHTDWRD